MYKKVKKAGKKKAKKAEPKVQAYDLENITKEELKKYVAFLEKELATMRKDCAFFNLNKDKIMDFLESRRNVLMFDKQSSVVRNAKRFDFEEGLKKYPEKNNERSIIKNQEKVGEQQQKVFQDFVIRSTTNADHLDTERHLKTRIADKQKLLEFGLYQNNMILMDLKEHYHSAQEELDSKHREKLEEVLLQYVAKCLEAKQDFNSEKLKTLVSVWDMKGYAHQSGIKESYLNEMKRMQDFFNDISTNNAEAIKILRSTLTNLQIESKKIKVHLRKIMVENAELKAAHISTTSAQSSATASERVTHNIEMVHSEKKMAKLQFRNDVLTEKLRMLKEDLQYLKKQFMSAIRKLYQKAEFKAFMIEEIIRMAIEMESLEEGREKTPFVASDKVRSRVTEKSRGSIMNVMKLSIENSDTIFVPPLYHEFWDPSLKLPRTCDFSK